MAKGKKKLDSKAFAQQKRHRRKWITFIRMCRYGVNNFTRNAWLTIAATAVMTITLFVIFASVAARNVLADTVVQVRDQVSMSIYLKTDAVEEDVRAVVEEVEKLDSVISVETVSPTQARESFVNDNKDNPETLEAVTAATNRFFWTLKIKVVDINDTSELADIVANNEIVTEQLDATRPPSFAGERREIIQNIGRAVDFAQNVGIVASSIFIFMSMLIIFNTIRMAIFNRREEIQMMKLIGAEKTFIRGPFVVEAMVYGFIAALIATGLGFAALYFIAPSLTGSGVNVQPTLDIMTMYGAFVLLAMIIIGAIIGIISSLLATRRYLKL